jgi:hypothetical protein
MRRRHLQRDPIKAYERQATAARRVGDGARCACSEARPGALIAGSDPVTCAECDRKEHGKTALDNHHVAGRANSSITVPVPVNDHRAILNEAQYDWPKNTLENPEASPFLAGAAYIRGLANTVTYLVGQLLWVAEMLETADTLLRKRLGRKWWRKTSLKQYVPKGR